MENLQKPFKQLSDQLQALVLTHLWAKILVGALLGISLGIFLGSPINPLGEHTSRIISNWAAFPGQLFLALIQMVVIPLVFASVIRGISASDNLQRLRDLGLRLAVYFIFTTGIAITIGMLVALFVEPGKYIDSQLLLKSVSQPNFSTETAHIVKWGMPDTLLTLLPENPLASMVTGQMLQIVLFALIFGVALMSLKQEQSEPILNLLGSLQEVCLIVVKWAMYLAPLAVFGLLAKVTTSVGAQAFIGIGVYVATVILGLLGVLAFYLLLVILFAKRNPIEFLKAIREVQLLSFSTSSSAAVMPLSIKTAEEKLGVKASISQFLVPLGATINMDGTALYQGVATVFLAQVFGLDLPLGSLLLVVATSVGASIGTPGTPGVGIVVLATVLQSVGIPTSGIALIIGVDRILDMCRTVINVSGDLTACLVMQRLGRDRPTMV